MTRLSFLPLALLAGAALGLSACVGGPASLGGEPPLTPASRYALQVETGLDRIALAVHDDGLSANQNAALAALVERFAAVGAGSITIEAPAGSEVTSVVRELGREVDRREVETRLVDAFARRFGYREVVWDERDE